MKTLTWSADSRVVQGRDVRFARFQERSRFPISAACLIAAAVREMLTASLGVAHAVRVIPPRIPDDSAWSLLAHEALVYGRRGDAGDAALVLRPQDALVVAGSVFGEALRGPRTLSRIEESVVVRALSSFCDSLAAACGTNMSPTRRLPGLQGYTSYFEVIVDDPVAFRLGVAIASETNVRLGRPLTLEQLGDVEIEISAQLDALQANAIDIARMHAGMILPLGHAGGASSVRVNGREIARGVFGAAGARAAVRLGAV